MWNTIKYTNCTVKTGGGKIPERLRHNQNVSIITSFNKSILNSFSRNQLLNLFVDYCGRNRIFAFTTKETKIIIK